jgi:hypothetical protein
MNTDGLLRFLTVLEGLEVNLNIHTRFNALAGALNNLTSQPNQPNYQTEVASRLVDIQAALKSVAESLSPAQMRLLNDIGGAPYFTLLALDEIKDLMVQNAMTPAVARDRVNQVVTSRSNYMTEISATKKGLERLGFKANGLEPGEAEIGFLIPRELFDNYFDGLIDELKDINQIIRWFSETTTGSVEPVLVRQLSSSDPSFFLGLNPVTVAEIAGAITWLLNTWKQVLEIKKIHHEARELTLAEDTLKALEKEVSRKIDSAISEKMQELLPKSRQSKERKHELESGLNWALQALFARIERGLTVEIRFVEPTKQKSESEREGEAEQPSGPDYNALRENVKGLVFPPTLGEPILKLSHADATKDQKSQQPKKPGRALDIE